MPNNKAHIPKHRIAKDARLALETHVDDHFDWIVVTAFYQALHWVDTFLAIKKRLPCKMNHTKREYAIIKEVDLDPIRQNYKNLSDASWKARYTKKNYNNDPAEVKDLIQIDLAAVVTRINGLINPAKT